MYVTAIVLAAGKGLRLKSKISKPLIEIRSQPLIIYCLKTLSKYPDIKDIIVVANPDNLKGIRDKIRQYRIGKIRKIVLGGRLRQNSVKNGLKEIDRHADLVLIHDAGRPFINEALVSTVIKTAYRYGAAIVGVPLKATIKRVKRPTLWRGRPESKVKTVVETLNRESLWEIQTPQVFKKELIKQAYKKFANTDATDDAFLVEKLGKQVRVVKGSYFNLKITTPEDLVLAKAIAKIR
jgi:2-C-methyl-D-erythritol 4-phosphate cytidylyltransferase